MAETGSVRSSEGASSSYAEEKERSIVTQKIDECKLQLKELNAVRAADVEKFIESTKKVETAHGFGDNPQINRMRHNFERKNRKHTSDSDALQKKLADYEEKLRQINSGEYEPSPTKSSRLRRTGTNIKGMTENVISGPLEIAHKIKSAFGSADDIRSHRSKNFDGRVGKSTFYSSQKRQSADGKAETPEKSLVKQSSTLPPGMRMGMTDFPVDFAATQANEESRTIPTNDDDFDARSNVSEERAGTKPSEQIHSLDASLCDEMSNRSGLGNTSLHFPLSPLAVIPIEHKDLLPQLNEQMQILVNYINFLEERYERLSKDLDHEMMTFASTLDEERFKITKLEEMLNDTIDLHQAEFESIKSQNDIAERIDYQHDKRIQNLEEKIESLQNHIIRLEETLNSLVEVRASKAPIWGSAALSGANILVEILKIVLFIVAATLDMLRPLTGSRNRAGFVIVALVLLFFFGHHITKYNPFSLFFWARNAVKNSTDKKT